MALMLGQLYGALRAGNVPDDRPRAAAEEVASYPGGLTKVRLETVELFQKMAECLNSEGDLRALKRKTGFLLALTSGAFAMEWRIALRLPLS